VKRSPPPSALTPDQARDRYPHELERAWQPDGTPGLWIRALRPDDLELERRFVAGLSPHTLYLRLQYAAAQPTEQDLARLLDVDYYDQLAVAALVDGPDGQQIVGVSRYARIPGTRRAECAVVVADAWQGLGLGTELMRTLATAALARDIDCLEGTALAENQRIGEWGRRFGFSVRTEPDSGGLVVVRIDLRDLDQAGG
jgi:acetyltransferase